MTYCRYVCVAVLSLTLLSCQAQAKTDNDRARVKELFSAGIEHFKRGEFVKAEAALTDALVLSKKTFGLQSEVTATINVNLATLYENLGDLDKSLHFHLQSLTIMRNLVWPTDPRLIFPLNNVASVLNLQKKGKQAEAYLRQARELLAKQEQPHHSLSAIVNMNLAEAYRLQGRLAQAEQLFESSRGVIEQRLGAQHQFLGFCVLGLARISASRGDWSKAKNLYDQALEILERTYPPSHPTIIEMKSEYADVLYNIKSQ